MDTMGIMDIMPTIPMVVIRLVRERLSLRLSLMLMRTLLARFMLDSPWLMLLPLVMPTIPDTLPTLPALHIPTLDIMLTMDTMDTMVTMVIMDTMETLDTTTI